MPSDPPPPRKRRRWLRWILATLLVFGVGLFFALQPIVFAIARNYIAKTGSERKLDIKYELGGSIWNRLKLSGVSVTPIAPGVVARVSVGEAEVHYNLWRLLRGGLRSDFLGAVIVRNAEIEIDPTQSPPAPASPTAPSGFEPPVIPLPESLVLENVTVRIKGGLQLTGLTLRLRSGTDDALQLERLEAPGLRPLGPLKGITSYPQRRLQIRDLTIAPEVAIENLMLTPAGVVDARLRLNGGSADLHAELAPTLRATLRGEKIALRWPEAILAAPAPIAFAGMLDRIEAEFTRAGGRSPVATAQVTLEASGLSVDEFGAARVSAQAAGTSAAVDLTQLAAWRGQAAVKVGEPKGGKIAADAISLSAALAENGAVTLTELKVSRGSNQVVASGTARIAEPLEADAKFALRAPDLSQLALAGEPPPITGALQGDGTVALRNGKPTGTFALEGTRLAARGGVIEQLTARLSAADGMVWLQQGEIRFDAENRIGLGGYARVDGRRDFRIELNATLPKLEAFAPTLKANGVPQSIAGSVQLQWLLTGLASDPTALRSTLGGGGTAEVRGLRIDDKPAIEADLTAALAGERLEVSRLALRSGELELTGTAKLADGLAALESVRLLRKRDPLLSGYARVPFDLDARKITTAETIDIDLATARPLPLAELWTAAGRTGPPPAAGTLALSLKARGGLRSLVLDLGLQGRALQRPELAKLKAADFDLSVGFKDNRARLDGTIRQPQLQPIALRAFLPLDLARLVETKQLPRDTPLEGSLKLPTSDLRVLLGVVPGLRFIEGNASADIALAGTIAQPSLRGSAQLGIPAARFENLSIPALRGVKFRLAFTDKEVRFEQGEAEIAGGKLNIRGEAKFPSVATASVDFAINAKDVLVARDESILIRTNADVKIAGPLASALVSGRVALTKSRFLKDVEIIPLRLPGEKKGPPPAPPAPRPRGTGADLGIQVPPLRDWKFDLVIVTDDPFRVSGNLARGRLNVNLKLTGTGGAPKLEGPVTIEQFSAKLPFSRFDVERGTIYFTPDQPLNPLLDINGASQVRDRRVNVSLFGRANDPKTAMSSEPPLPQEQILTLLATGATLDELRENTGALAGKAAVLAAQKLWRRFFPAKRGGPEEDSILDRFDLDLGNADPKTGAQTVSARYRISDRVIFLSDFDQDGNFRGRVKYLIRFR